MIQTLKGKRVLLFVPAFFGYEYKIKFKMEEMGAEVDLYDERSVVSAISRAFLKVIPRIFDCKSYQYYMRILKSCKEKDFDFIVIIRCDMVSKKILKMFKTHFSNAIFCLYLYDSVNYIKGIEKKFKYFNYVFSFDRQDIQKYNFMIFRPLFYADDFIRVEEPNRSYKYDLSFCGTIHTDRYVIIKNAIRYCKERNLSYYTFCYLPDKFIYYFYKIMKKEFLQTVITDFNFQKMSSKEISDVVNNSNVILDIQGPKQTGLTMRTIEMIGMNKKIITTNKDIVNYDFYKPENILVINRETFNAQSSFFNTQYVPLDIGLYKKYSLESWVNDILLVNATKT